MPTDVSPYPMVAVGDAIAAILGAASPLPVETVRRGDSLGRVLAEDVVSTIDLPPFVASTVDGYAVRSDDGTAARRLVGDIRAGASGGPVGSGETARIMTGAPLPSGADTVVMLEDSIVAGEMMTPEATPKAGDYLRPVGSDIAVGDTVLTAGTRVGPIEIGLLATIGRATVMAHRLPRVAVLSTGDEVVDADATPTGPAIRDSNGPTLLAAIREMGYPATFIGIIPDDEAAQQAAIAGAISQADVVLTSGGVSVGNRDLIKAIFDRLGTIHFGRVNFKPGKPLTFAQAGAVLLFGLPGNPVSAMVCLSLFVRPALRKLAGERDVQPAIIQAEAGEVLRPSSDRPDYQRAIVSWDGGRLVVRVTGPQGSSRLRSLAGSNALVALRAGTEPIPSGALVDVILTGPVGGDRRFGG